MSFSGWITGFFRNMAVGWKKFKCEEWAGSLGDGGEAETRMLK